MSVKDDERALYMRNEGDPNLKDYKLEWLNDVAEDATLEGSFMDGVVVGREGLVTVLSKIRGLYEKQIFDWVGPYGENGWIEEYVVHVEGETLGGVVLVKRNEAGQTQHVIAGYRPRTSVLYLSRRLREELAGTPYAEHFASASS
jgi:hypothetical protein